MNIRPAVALAVVLLGWAAGAAPSVAASDQTSARSAEPSYRTVTWTSQGAEMSVQAPTGWSFVLTPEGQARFNAPAGRAVLTMGYRGEQALGPQVRDKLSALAGTPGLRVLVAQGRGRGDTASGELRYTWEPEPGGARFVDYRYLGNDVFMVAGPLADRNHLRAVLETALMTGECS